MAKRRVKRRQQATCPWCNHKQPANKTRRNCPCGATLTIKRGRQTWSKKTVKIILVRNTQTKKGKRYRWRQKRALFPDSFKYPQPGRYEVYANPKQGTVTLKPRRH